jgi:hypothetical protein
VTFTFIEPKTLPLEEGFQPFAQGEDEIDYDAAMRLPAGKTCGDCVHVRRCVAMFGHVPADTSCDFYPSRFRPALTTTSATPVSEAGR